MSETIKYAIEIVDKWNKPLKQFDSALDKVDKKRIDPFAKMPKSLANLRSNLARYQKLQGETLNPSHFKRYGSLIDATSRKISTLENSATTCKTKTSDMLGSLGKKAGWAGFIYGATRAVNKVVAFGNESIQASAKFEKYQVTLKTMLGSQGAARERMAEYAKIGATTPFELDQVVSAGNQLQAIGRYSKDNLLMLGDLAAASGKPIEQVMNAYAKLSTGQKGEGVNMFRDLLISNDDWIEATGRGVKKNGELVASTEDMIKALPKILGKKGFMGMMAEQARTTEGMVSNLADSTNLLKVAVGDRLKPTYDGLLKSTTALINDMTKMVEIPLPEKIAREKSELNSLIGVITDTNTEEGQRSALLTQLQQQYPEFLKGINLETVKNEELRKKLVGVNAEYEKKIELANVENIKEKADTNLNKEQEELTRLLMVRESVKDLRKYDDFLDPIMADYTEINYSSHGKAGTFEDYVKAEALKHEKNYKTTGASADLKWLNNYRNYKGATDAINEYTGIFGGTSDLDSKIDSQRKIVAMEQSYVDNLGAREKELENQELLRQARGLDLTDEDTYSRLFGKKGVEGADAVAKVFSEIIAKPLEEIQQWDKLQRILDGSEKYRTTATGGSVGGDIELENQLNTITGGGRSMKNIVINLDSLIRENTNIFKEGDTVEDADDFLEKLTTSLQLVVNDTNMAV